MFLIYFQVYIRDSKIELAFKVVVCEVRFVQIIGKSAFDP